MSATVLTAFLARCRVLYRPHSHVEDAELLRRFTQQRDAVAFEQLLERYGSLVWGVCRRLLPAEADCEDAFQATFLALVRRPEAIDPKQPLGAWLHTVALRVARKAQVRSLRQRPQAVLPERTTTGDVADEVGSRELFRMVDEEIERLPDTVRASLILCCLQGRTRDEAAEALGCSVTAIKGRLKRGRDLLRRRLERRGVQLPVAFLVLSLTGTSVRASLRAKAVQCVLGSVPSAVAALVPAVGASLASKLTLTAMSLVMVGALGFGAFRVMEAEPPQEALPQANRQRQLPGEAYHPAADAAGSPHLDQFGDPLPPGAVARLGSIRLRPGGAVNLLAFSPDGSKIASWSSELYVTDSLCIWDRKSGRLLRRVDLPGAQMQSLAWRPDGHGIALLSPGRENPGLRVWDFTDEKADPKIAPRGAMGGRVGAAPAGGPPDDNEADSCYAISPDGKTLAIGRSGTRLDKERPIRLRPLKSGVPIDELPAAKDLVRHPGNCAMLLFTPNGKRLVAVNAAKLLEGNRLEDKQRVVVWDVAGGKEVVRFTAPRPARNTQVAIAVSDRQLALGLEDGATSLWDLSNGKERRLDTDHVGKRPGQGCGTLSVAFTPDGKTLVTGGNDCLVKLSDVAGGRRLHTLERHYSWVEALAVSSDGRAIASSGQDGLIRLWDAASGADACPHTGHHSSLLHTALSPDGKIVVTAGVDQTLRWWDTVGGRQMRVVELTGFPDGLAISPEGKSVLATVHDERLHTWDLATSRETTPKDLPREKVGALAFTPDGKQFLSASGPHISIWNWPSMKLIRTIELPKPAKSPGENACHALAISPDGRRLVTVAHRYWFREEKGLHFGYAADGVVDLWDLTDGKRVRRLVEGQGTFRSATFTADGLLVLVGGGGTIPAEGKRSAQSFQGEMNLLDPLAARRLRSFTSPPPTPGVRIRYSGASLLSPDGRTLYVSYNTGAIVGFEVATGQPRRTLLGHRGYVSALEGSPDGRRLISGGKDGTGLVWDVTLAAAATSRKQPLDNAAIEKLWKKATQPEAHDSFAALADLAAAPEQAVALLRKQIKPIPKGPTDAELDRLFEKLDSDDFATRDKASLALAAFGEAAVPGVRKRLVKGISLEVRLRALMFLDHFDHKEMSRERLRQTRAVELLEGIGTPSATGLLAELAKGAPGVPLTLEATAAQARLQRGKAKSQHEP